MPVRPASEPLGLEGPGTPPHCPPLPAWERPPPHPVPRCWVSSNRIPTGLESQGAEGAFWGGQSCPALEETPGRAGNASPLAQLFSFRGLSSLPSSISSISRTPPLRFSYLCFLIGKEISSLYSRDTVVQMVLLFQSPLLLAGYFVMKGTETLSQPRHLPPSLKHNATLN